MKKDQMIYFAIVILIIGMIIFAGYEGGITGRAAILTDSVMCSGGDFGKMSSLTSGLRHCDNYRDIFLKYMKEYDISIDLLLVYALAFQESGCQIAPRGSTRCGGIMQVDHGCLDRRDCLCANDVDFAIQKGIEELSQKYETLTSQGISGSDAFKLVLFGYNRGVAAGTRAAEYVRGGMDLHTAMTKACDDFYPISSVSGMCGTNWNYQRCCDSPGLGAGYPDRVLSHFEKACTEIGGTPSLGLPTLPGGKETIPFRYYLKPSFKVHINYNLEGTYSELIGYAKSSIEKIKSCFKSGKSPSACSKEAYIISEAKEGDKKEYQIKFTVTKPFAGKYYTEPATYKFAAILTDTFAPPEIKFITKEKINGAFKITWDATSYDTKTYYLTCDNTITHILSSPSFTGNCNTVIIRAEDDVGNRNNGKTFSTS